MASSLPVSSEVLVHFSEFSKTSDFNLPDPLLVPKDGFARIRVRLSDKDPAKVGWPSAIDGCYVTHAVVGSFAVVDSDGVSEESDQVCFRQIPLAD